jgi:anaerobic selenocysteine-containing dehydrogenase
MHVIIAEEYYDRDFVERHTVGFKELADHVRGYSPSWAAKVTCIPEERIVPLARRYATTRPAMIVLGGSSMYKGANGWQAARAVACLPALTGNLGIPGGGLGPRHGSKSYGQSLANITAEKKRLPATYIPNQMSHIISALRDGRVRTMLLFGTNMLSSFADAEKLALGLSRAELVVSYDLFMNDTGRRFADVILPAAFWLEQLGCKMTHTHLYLMEQAMGPPGEAQPISSVLAALAERLNLTGFYPWDSEEGVIDDILNHPSTGYATVASLRAQGGIAPLKISDVAYPDARFHTPSGRVEFFSARAQALGLPPLPIYEELPASSYPLVFRQGRTLTHFHSFYDHGQALPTLARLDPEPRLWIAPTDAAVRDLKDGSPIRIYNERGAFQARAYLTDKIPPGTVWMRDGWEGLNRLTSGRPVLPDEAVDIFPFSAGQAAFEAMVEVTPL